MAMTMNGQLGSRLLAAATKLGESAGGNLGNGPLIA